jgi:putative peptidoglycan lipid II flippase
MVEDEKKEIRRASWIMGSLTFVSRLLGLVRNQILGHYFGAGFVADAFVAAFTIPNALRRLFGEGALTPVLVSLFTRSLKEGDWKVFLNRSFTALTLALIFLVVAGIAISPWLVSLYVPEFKEIPGKFELTVELTRFLFVFILFIGWSAFFMGVLNSFRSFGLPAFGPAALNLAVIGLVPLGFWLLSPDETDGIFLFGGAMLVGGLFQALIQLPRLKSLKAIPRLDFQFNDTRVKEMALLLLPSTFAMGIYQLNIIVNRVFASGIEGAVSQLFYADLILELPVSLIAVSLGTAVVPSFSRLLNENNRQEFSSTLSYSLENVWFLSLPAMAGLLALSLPIVTSLYLTGRFTVNDAEVVAACLVMYSLGLPFFAGLRILVPVFFAQKDTRTPAQVAVVALAVNLAGAWTLSDKMGAPGIALATSIASCVQFFILLALIVKRFPEMQWRPLIVKTSKIVGSALLMGVALTFLSGSILPSAFWLAHGLSLAKVLSLLGLVTLGGLGFGIVSHAMGLPHASLLWQRLRYRVKK